MSAVARINFDVDIRTHRKIKATAHKKGMTIKEYILAKVLDDGDKKPTTRVVQAMQEIEDGDLERFDSFEAFAEAVKKL